jgi:hypothetical protein
MINNSILSHGTEDSFSKLGTKLHYLPKTLKSNRSVQAMLAGSFHDCEQDYHPNAIQKLCMQWPYFVKVSETLIDWRKSNSTSPGGCATVISSTNCCW